jgi:transcriptional regulator with PAS, ATPase and Fis domain
MSSAQSAKLVELNRYAPRGLGSESCWNFAGRWMKNSLETIDCLAFSSIPVLIAGETGVGKEIFARGIHERGPRRDTLLYTVNCAAIPGQLVESTFFGHEKGAFTGALQEQKGIFEVAHGGTVFLDEIGELQPNAQAALLRVLESKKITRVGATREREVDVRIIAATHRELEAMCSAGLFRWDLFYRLDVMAVHIPSLRERPDEILELATCFLEQANRANHRRIHGIDEAAQTALRRYAWPGNVRELKNAIERAVVMARGDRLTTGDLPERLRAEPRVKSRAAELALSANDFQTKMLHCEAQIIVESLEQTGGNQTAAARLLRMPLRTFVHKMKVLNIKKLGYRAAR